MFNLPNRLVPSNGARLASLGTGSLNGPKLQTLTPFLYLMGMALVLIVLLAHVEPAGSAGLDLPARALFWSLHLVPATIAAWLISGWLFNLRASRHIPSWALLVIAGAFTGLLLAPVSAALEMFFGVLEATDAKSQQPTFSLNAWMSEFKDELRDLPLATASLWPLMNVFVAWRVSDLLDDSISKSLHEIQQADLPRMSSVQTPEAEGNVLTGPNSDHCEQGAVAKHIGPKAETNGFLGRLPARLGRDIVFVEAQEHYLRVVTARGEHLLLNGLAKAVAELEESGFAGTQIHRSVWVAWKHIVTVEVGTGAVTIVVSTGDCLKIGRRRVGAFLAAWRQRHT